MLEAPVTRGVAVLAAALAVLAGALLWRSHRVAEPDPEGTLSAAPAPREDAVVVNAGPGAERSVAGAWTPARAGDALRRDDALRTAPGSSAELAFVRGARVTVSELSEVSVRDAGAAQRLRLVRGRIGVDLRAEGARALRVEDASGAVSAAMGGGRFGLVARADALAVAATEGSARVEAGGETVVVPAGTETVAWRGARPLPPRPIPRDLVLRVANRIDERRASFCAVLQVAVASQLSVNGEDVPVPPDGVVVLRVPPRGRSRGADVVLRHANGGVESRHIDCAQPDGDVSGIEVRWNAR